ncbi:MAG: hypothetical protein JNL21_36965 [Myxococcales bacterium]|nr:hypothetical protein [Myxococcales bacterium]
MPQRARSTPLRLGHRVAAVWALIAVIGACRDTLVGDSEDVATELCTILADCEPVDPACEALEQRFRQARDPEVTDAFLQNHARHDCLASCSSARACRDVPPVCRAFAEFCAEDVDCCGSTQGIGACRAGTCCAPLGAPCAGEGECCGGETCVDGHCGQFRCALLDEPCERSSDCCSRLCRSGQCEAKTCSDFGEACVTEGDCCQGGLTCRDGLCLNPIDTCDSCSPVSDPEKNCCLASGLVCYVRVDDTSFCGVDGACAQAGVECGGNADCCAGMCEESFLPHCCSPPGEPCLVDVECCSPGQCTDGVCL